MATQMFMCKCAHSLSHVWLYDPMDHSPPDSSVHGISQERISTSICNKKLQIGKFGNFKNWKLEFSIAGEWVNKLRCMHACYDASVLTLCNTMDFSPPGSSVHGLLQARVLGWVAMASSQESSQPRDWTCVSFIGRWVLYHQWHLESHSELLIHQTKQMSLKNIML